MHLISHRGNIDGRQAEKENSPKYIEMAINKGFEVEVDVRFEKNKFFLGHDENQFEVEKNFLLNKKIEDLFLKTIKSNLALKKLKKTYSMEG